MINNLSNLANTLTGQPMFQFAKQIKELEAQGQDFIHFEIGDPYFHAPNDVKNAVKLALDNNETHYCDPRGLVELREEIAADTERRLGFCPSINQIVVAPANALISYVLQCLVNPGDTVIYPDPGFPTYKAAIDLVGANAYPIYYKFFHPYINARCFIFNSPSNPTGYVNLESDEDEYFVGCLGRHGSFIVSDEVYSEIVYGGFKSKSYAEIDKCQNNVIILNSFSKSFSMAGFRIGYVIAPEYIADKVALLVETTLSCIPPFIQKGAIAAYHVDKEVYEHRLQVFKERRDLLVNGLNNIKGFNCELPKGAFYTFPKIEFFNGDSKKFSDHLLKYGVAALDGGCFGENGRGFMRFSYSYTTTEMIEIALERIERAVKEI